MSWIPPLTLTARQLKSGGSDDGSAPPIEHSDAEAHIPLHFVWFVTALFASWIVWIKFKQRHRERKTGDGWLVLDEWGPGIRSTVSFVWVFFAFVPVALFFCSCFFGGILALAEGWGFYDGFYYVAANILGLFHALTDVNPTTPFASIVDIIICLYALVATNMIVGVVTMLQFVEYHADAVPDDNIGLARYLFVYIPLFLFAFGWLMGGIVAVVEGWSFFHGFLHMTGTLCGLANPIDDEVILTKMGMFVESICACLNLGFVALVLQIVAKHPFFQTAMANVEGSYASFIYSRRSTNVQEFEQKLFEECSVSDEQKQLEAGKLEAESHIIMMKGEASAACLENFEEHMDKVSKYVKDLEQQVAVLTKEREHIASIALQDVVSAALEAQTGALPSAIILVKPSERQASLHAASIALQKDAPPSATIFVKASDEQPSLHAPQDVETEN